MVSIRVGVDIFVSRQRQHVVEFKKIQAVITLEDQRMHMGICKRCKYQLSSSLDFG